MARVADQGAVRGAWTKPPADRSAMQGWTPVMRRPRSSAMDISILPSTDQIAVPNRVLVA
jgi:hypothetical protein